MLILAVKNKPSKAVLGILASACFVLVGIWATTLLGFKTQLCGWGIIVIFGGASLVLASTFFDKAVQLIIDDRGVLLRCWSQDTVPWSSIVLVEYRMNQSALWFRAHRRALALTIDAPGRFRPSRFRSVLRLNMFAVADEVLLLSSGTLACSFSDIANAVAIRVPVTSWKARADVGVAPFF